MDAQPEVPTVQQTIITRMIVEREREIATFYGDDPSRAHRFEEDVHRAWTTMATGDTWRRMDCVLSHIGTQVRAEVSCLDDATRKDPERVLRHIIDRFGERRSTDELLRVLMTTEQRPGESVMSYSHRTRAAFDALVNRQEAVGETSCPEAVLRNRFARSVVDRQLARHLRMTMLAQPTISFNGLREIAMLWAEDEESPVAQSAAVRLHVPAAVAALTPDPAIAELTQQLDQLEKLVCESLPRRSGNATDQC